MTIVRNDKSAFHDYTLWPLYTLSNALRPAALAPQYSSPPIKTESEFSFWQAFSPELLSLPSLYVSWDIPMHPPWSNATKSFLQEPAIKRLAQYHSNLSRYTSFKWSYYVYEVWNISLLYRLHRQTTALFLSPSIWLDTAWYIFPFMWSLTLTDGHDAEGDAMLK